jgi:hypothetical protein
LVVAAIDSIPLSPLSSPIATVKGIIFMLKRWLDGNDGGDFQLG